MCDYNSRAASPPTSGELPEAGELENLLPPAAATHTRPQRAGAGRKKKKSEAKLCRGRAFVGDEYCMRSAAAARGKARGGSELLKLSPEKRCTLGWHLLRHMQMIESHLGSIPKGALPSCDAHGLAGSSEASDPP